jgi:hypothetical protein
MRIFGIEFSLTELAISRVIFSGALEENNARG